MKIDVGNDKCRYCNSALAPGTMWPTLSACQYKLTLLFIILTEDVGLVWDITCPALQC